MIRKFELVFLALVVAIAPGCSFLRDSREAVQVLADPEATIFVDGEEQGKGSRTLYLTRSGNHSIRARIIGQGAGRLAQVNQGVSFFGIVDITLGIAGIFCIVTLPFWFGLTAPGFYSLDPVKVDLRGS